MLFPQTGPIRDTRLMESSTAGLQLASFVLSQLEDSATENLRLNALQLRAGIYSLVQQVSLKHQVGVWNLSRHSDISSEPNWQRVLPTWGPHPTAVEAWLARTLVGEAWCAHTLMRKAFHYLHSVLSLLPVFLSLYLRTLSVSTTLWSTQRTDNQVIGVVIKRAPTLPFNSITTPIPLSQNTARRPSERFRPLK